MTDSTFSDFARFSRAHTQRFAHRMPAAQVSTLTLVLTADALAMRSASRASRASRFEGRLWAVSCVGALVPVVTLLAAAVGAL